MPSDYISDVTSSMLLMNLEPGCTTIGILNSLSHTYIIGMSFKYFFCFWLCLNVTFCLYTFTYMIFLTNICAYNVFMVVKAVVPIT